MPRTNSFAGGSATALIPLTIGPASGSATSSVASPTVYASGSATVDNTVAIAFLSVRNRLTTAAVTLEDTDVQTLVGTLDIEETLDDPIKYASFDIAAPEVAFHHASSYANGDKAVSIDLYAGPPGGVESWTAFVGTTEAAQNSGPYRPIAKFRAASLAAKWADKPGCIRYPPLAGYHRGALLAAMFASVGASVTNADIETMGAIVKRPQDLMGVTALQYAKRIGEIEGWWIRGTNSGDVEVVTDEQLLGGPSIYDFDETNVFSVDETPPTRPTTVWVLSSTQLNEESLAPGLRTEVVGTSSVDQDGLPYSTVVEITTDHGTEVFRRTSEWRSVAADGITLGPVTYQPVSVVEVKTDWEPGAYDTETNSYSPSTRINTRKTLNYKLAGTPVATDYSAPQTWASGGDYWEPRAALILIEKVTEDYEWDPTTCILKSVKTTREQLYSPLTDPALGSSHPYQDGTYRAADIWTMQTVAEVVDYWNDYREENTRPTVIKNEYRKRFRADRFAASPYESHVIETYGNAEQVREEWTGNESATSWTHTTSTTWPREVVRLANSTLPVATTETEYGEGPVPGPPSGSADVPQIVQDAIIQTYDLSSALSQYTVTKGEETIEQAESLDELIAVGLRRIRRALDVWYVVTHRDIPYLKVGDHVTLTNHARSMATPVDGFVWSIKRSRTFATGDGRQVTTIRIPQAFP